MNRSLYIAATGMNAQQAQMDVISNNLANVSTNGFKGSRAVFEDLLYQTIRQPGANSTQQTELRRLVKFGKKTPQPRRVTTFSSHFFLKHKSLFFGLSFFGKKRLKAVF